MTKQHQVSTRRRITAGATVGVVALLVTLATATGGVLATAAPPSGNEGMAGEAAAKPPAIVAREAQAVNDGQQSQAAGVKMRPAPQVDVEKLKGSGNGGCVVGYGKPGQCLPAVPPSHAAHAAHGMDMPWTCEELRTIFVDGITVERGKDTLKLDTNNDGVACGQGDAG
ncbi:MAG: hypothetical protein ABI568_11240 [Pseudarthrobacter sp.]